MEIAPGVDLERDVLEQMDFRPRISDDLKEMDRRLFLDQPMGLAADLAEKRPVMCPPASRNERRPTCLTAMQRFHARPEEADAIRVTRPRPGVALVSIVSAPLGVLRHAVKRALWSTLRRLEADPDGPLSGADR